MSNTAFAPSTVHVFERRGLGKAPYAYLGMDVVRGPFHVGLSTIGSPGQPMGACQYCNTSIAYLFWLESADGKKFYVGSDCIFKSGDVGLRNIIAPIVAKHNAEFREARQKTILDLFDAFLKANPNYWASDTRPHPFTWRARQGATYGDYTRYIFMHAGVSKKASLARQLLIAANVPLPETRRRKKGKAKAKDAKPVVHIIPGRFGDIRIIDVPDDYPVDDL